MSINLQSHAPKCNGHFTPIKFSSLWHFVIEILHHVHHFTNACANVFHTHFVYFYWFITASVKKYFQTLLFQLKWIVIPNMLEYETTFQTKLMNAGFQVLHEKYAASLTVNVSKGSFSKMLRKIYQPVIKLHTIDQRLLKFFKGKGLSWRNIRFCKSSVYCSL